MENTSALLCPACKRPVAVGAKACPHCNKPFGQKNFLKVGAIGCGGLLGGFILLGIIGSFLPEPKGGVDKKSEPAAVIEKVEEPEKVDLAEIFSDLHPSIVHFDATGPNLNFTVKLELLTEGTLGMTQVGRVVQQITEAIQENAKDIPPDVKWVQMQLHFASIDRLGNEGFVDFGTLRFPVSDLKAVKIKKLGALRLMGLADMISPSNGFGFAENYCAEPDQVAESGEFCLRVAQALL